jgi:hypothetical protein
MTCKEFEQWLDDGGDENAAMKAHAAGCFSCARQLRAAVELDGALAMVSVARLDSTFNDNVMRKIHSENRMAGVVVSVLAEPLVPISLALAMIAGWKYRALSAAAAQGAQTIALAIEGSLAQDVSLGASAAIALAMAGVSWTLFRRLTGSITP